MAAALGPPPPSFATHRSARPARGELVLHTAIVLRGASGDSVAGAGDLRSGTDPGVAVAGDHTSQPALLGESRLAARVVGGRCRETVSRARIGGSGLVFDRAGAGEEPQAEHHALLHHARSPRERCTPASSEVTVLAVSGSVHSLYRPTTEGEKRAWSFSICRAASPSSPVAMAASGSAWRWAWRGPALRSWWRDATRPRTGPPSPRSRASALRRAPSRS